jgi:hypothetical protein
MQRLLPLFTLSILLLPGCATRHPEDLRAVDSLRIETEDFLRAQAAMGYDNWVAGSPSNQDSLYRLHAGLFTRPVIDLVARAREEEPDTLQRRRLAIFQRFLTLEHLSRAAARLTDRSATYEGEARVTVGSDTVFYRQLPSLIANEQSRQRRERLYVAADPVLDSLSRLAEETERTYGRLALELGYPSYSGMIEQLKGFSLASVRELATEALAVSESLYMALLTPLLRRATGLQRSEAHRYDLATLLRSPEFDRFFPRGETVASVTKTYRSLGIDLSSQRNLSLDTADRPAKNPRAVCFAITVPGDVRVSIKPAGGVDDFAALYHEMGHAQHYAHVTEHALEFKYLGEATLTETYAFLSEYLLCNPAWLRQNSRLPVPLLKDYARQMALARLYLVRRYCAKFLFEEAFHADARTPDSLYAATLASALGYAVHPSDGKRSLVDMDAHFYSASYLRAWFLEAQLNRWLSGTYGVNWYENPRAGAFLTSLWAQGDRPTAEDIVAAIGESRINCGAWMAEIRDLVRLAAREDRP